MILFLICLETQNLFSRYLQHKFFQSKSHSSVYTRNYRTRWGVIRYPNWSLNQSPDIPKTSKSYDSFGLLQYYNSFSPWIWAWIDSWKTQLLDFTGKKRISKASQSIGFCISKLTLPRNKKLLSLFHVDSENHTSPYLFAQSLSRSSHLNADFWKRVFVETKFHFGLPRKC